MDILIALVLLGVFLIVLNQSSLMTITYAVKVSDIAGLGKTTIGFSLLAFSTSLPELSVAFTSAFTGESRVSVGNVIGSNIVNISLIVGLAALIMGRKHPHRINVIPSFATEELKSVYFGLFISSVIPLSLLYIARASWLVGLILIAVFAIYTYQLSRIRIPSENRNNISERDKTKLRRYVLLALVGVFGVIVSASILVQSAVAIAEFAGVPRILIGATVIAFGTSLPELTLDLRSFLKGHPALAFGDIIGSSFVNTTLILGITLFVPILFGTALTMDMIVFQNLVIFSLITNLFFWYFLSTGSIGLKEGLVFLFIYVLFLATTLGAINLSP